MTSDPEQRIITLERKLFPIERRISQAGVKAGRARGPFSSGRSPSTGKAIYVNLMIDDGVNTPSYPIPFECVIEVHDSGGRFVGNMPNWDSVGKIQYGPLIVPDDTYTLSFIPPTDGSGKVRFDSYSTTVTVSGADATADILPTAASGFVCVSRYTAGYNDAYPLSTTMQAASSLYGNYMLTLGSYVADAWSNQTATINYPGFGIGAIACAPQSAVRIVIFAKIGSPTSPSCNMSFGYNDYSGTFACPQNGVASLTLSFLYSNNTAPILYGAFAPVSVVFNFPSPTSSGDAYRFNQGNASSTVTVTEL